MPFPMSFYFPTSYVRTRLPNDPYVTDEETKSTPPGTPSTFAWIPKKTDSRPPSLITDSGTGTDQDVSSRCSTPASGEFLVDGQSSSGESTIQYSELFQTRMSSPLPVTQTR